MPDLAALNALSLEELREALRACCGSSRWVEAVTRQRPFRDEAHLFAAAEHAFVPLQRPDWMEAFSHHPRIGATVAAPPSGRGWEANEQAGAAKSPEQVKAALAEGNQAYEQRFGHIYLVCATGKTGEQMLELLRARMQNDPEAELEVASGEQQKITRLRLEKLLRS
jgi:2-oxo-4-hydroxy-4-carboxy-5-ureidoimidazoline decarboxylase